MSGIHKARLLILSTLVGVLIGWLATAALLDSEPTTVEKAGAGAGGRAHLPRASGPSPHAKGGGGANPHAKGGQEKSPHGSDEARQEGSFAKVHFMKKFVAALRTLPKNKWPASAYQPLLKDGATLNCAGCHDPAKINMEGMLKNDPGHHAVESFRKNPNFMIPLMQKWVARLNRDHAARLKQPVTCNDCHAISPVEAWNALPPLMVKFVDALKRKPTNKQPAPDWKPLLKDPLTPAMLCASCHGTVGKAMERDVKMFQKAPRPPAADDKAFMIELMQRWVRRLNQDAKDLLVRPVTCVDCHETEPKR